MLNRIQKLERMVKWLYCKVKNTAIGGIQSIVAGDNITVDNSDPANPIVSSTGGGSDDGVITEDSDTVAFTGNGTVGTPLKAEVKSDGLDYIPLTGTEVGKPVTGNVKWENNSEIFQGINNTQIGGDEFSSLGFRRFADGREVFIGINEGDNRFEMSTFEDSDNISYFAATIWSYTSGGITKAISISSGNGVLIQDNEANSPGLTGYSDFTPYINDLDYTQKKYVDDPETLITVLNNANSTQLATIKGLLGIV